MGTSIDTPVAVEITWRDTRLRRNTMSISIIGAWGVGATMRFNERS